MVMRPEAPNWSGMEAGEPHPGGATARGRSPIQPPPAPPSEVLLGPDAVVPGDDEALDFPMPERRYVKLVRADVHDARVSELIAVNNRSQDAERGARRAQADAEYEAATWKRRALEWRRALQRVNPAWEGT